MTARRKAEPKVGIFFLVEVERPLIYYGKGRYRGLTKDLHSLDTCFALLNLIATQKLLVPQGSSVSGRRTNTPCAELHHANSPFDFPHIPIRYSQGSLSASLALICPY